MKIRTLLLVPAALALAGVALAAHAQQAEPARGTAANQDKAAQAAERADRSAAEARREAARRAAEEARKAREAAEARGEARPVEREEEEDWRR